MFRDVGLPILREHEKIGTSLITHFWFETGEKDRKLFENFRIPFAGGGGFKKKKTSAKKNQIIELNHSTVTYSELAEPPKFCHLYVMTTKRIASPTTPTPQMEAKVK
mmetsp:Transcript_16521/g.22864  ORF Transcript_16521/g.22864 Transcript_16521/m.22864 type:complete len:107 (+) Transcript_16521:70-390(+)